jgi:CheY-like chemotaxis protein
MSHKKPLALDNSAAEPDGQGWPQQTRLILAALDAASEQRVEREGNGQTHYQARGTLELFGDPADQLPRKIYTRKVDSHGLTFIGPDELPLGCGAILRLPTPDGRQLEMPCTVMLSRPVAPGWYKGAAHFRHEERDFLPTCISAYRPPQRRVLIVDDDEQIARLVRLVLETGGYKCSTATSGAQACGRLTHEQFDLIITDLRMSCGDGFALIDAVRRTSGVPVIVMSGCANDHGVRLRALEIASILPKPIDIDALLLHVCTCLNRSPRAQHN